MSSNGVKKSDRDPESVCNVGDCGAWKTGDLDFCHHHQGLAQGREESDGAPEGNNNAVRHTLHANRDSLYEYFPESYKREVDKIEAALLNRYEEYHGREPDAADAKDCYELAIGYVQRQYARDYMVEEAAESGNPLLQHVEMVKNGEQIEFDKPNDVMSVVNDIRREDRLTRQTKGLEKDPESQKADSMDNLHELWVEDLE